MKAKQKKRSNGNKKERIQTRVAFGWLSGRSGEKTSCPRTFWKSIDTSLLRRHTVTRLANRTMLSPYGFLWRENEVFIFGSFHLLIDKQIMKIALMQVFSWQSFDRKPLLTCLPNPYRFSSDFRPQIHLA